MRNLADSLKVRDVILGISNAFQIDSLGLVIDQVLEVLWLVAIDEFRVDSQAREGDLELVVGTAVQVRGRDDVVSGLSERCDGQELSSLT